MIENLLKEAINFPLVIEMSPVYFLLYVVDSHANLAEFRFQRPLWPLKEATLFFYWITCDTVNT